MRRTLSRPQAALALLLATACAPSPAPDTPPPSPDATVEAGDALGRVAETTITAEQMSEHIAFLAADEMRGRDTPSPELEVAASYLADYFEAAGLEPAGDDGSFIQRWSFTRAVLDRSESRAGFGGTDTQRTWVYGEEYFAIPSPDAEVEGSPVYLANPAAVAAGLPAEAMGGILLVPLPEGLDESFGLVLQSAMGAGAAAVVIIMDEETPASEMFQLTAALEAGAAGQLPFPVFGLRHDVGEELLRSAGVDPGTAPDSPVLEEVTVSLRSVFDVGSDEVPNVVGMVRGADEQLADTYVLVTAHFDHVGVGPPDTTGDSIYSGADDNASGTVALMEMAAAFAALPTPPARSVVFLAVSGEEKGLLGSRHYAQSPTVPAEGIVANINLDMVGRNHPDTVYAIGDVYTTIGSRAHRIAAERPELGLVVAPDPEPEEMAFLRSDHYSFVELGVPALMLTSWLHDDYHVPSDTPDRVDADKAARVTRLTFYLTHAVADDPSPPEWTDEGEALLEGLPAF